MGEIERLLYKRIAAGDVLKLRAESATSGTGGGARDLRFRPWTKFEPVVRVMFPQVESKISRRKEKGPADKDVWVPHTTTVYVGWMHNESGDEPHEVRFWEPTRARSNEGRLARINEIPQLHHSRLPEKSPHVGATIALVVQDADGLLNARWITEGALRDAPGWNPTVRDGLVAALDATPADETLRGWMDLIASRSEHLTGRG
jgi:hypothetical protein